MKHDIKTRVRTFIADNFDYRADASLLSETASLMESGLIDSMGVLELITFLESEFDIHVSDDEVLPENLDSISAIVALVDRKLSCEQAA